VLYSGAVLPANRAVAANWARAALLAAVLSACTSPAADSHTRIEVTSRAVLIATIDARCDRCAWNVEGREAATFTLALDGRYAQHLPLVRRGRAEYKVLVGTVERGTHSVSLALDRAASARELQADAAASATIVDLHAVQEGDADYEALSLAPFLYARPNTIGRFSDVPVFMWYEREPTPRGLRYRYSAIFTNEDGGTPADRLMATWGRTTDIEYVYSVEVDAKGTILADDIQGPDHAILAFNGTREGRHPLLWVSTDNNMVLPTGSTSMRHAPAPVAFVLEGVSREAVMDANAWLYAVAGEELEREGKIVADAPPGKGTIPDPRNFVYVEACGVVGTAALSFEIGIGDSWLPSDRGVPQYRITRDGCFRAAAPAPAGTTAKDLRGLRALAHARPADNGEPPPPPHAVRLDRINTVFMLDKEHKPGPSVLRCTGPATVAVGKPLAIPISP
jgi:hypothetical protein